MRSMLYHHIIGFIVQKLVAAEIIKNMDCLMRKFIMHGET